MGYVPVQYYAISSNKDELITDGLNACSALGFEAQGKVFLAHFTRNVESRIPAILKSIKREFDIRALQTSDIKLLDRFVKQVQQYVKKILMELWKILA